MQGSKRRKWYYRRAFWSIATQLPRHSLAGAVRLRPTANRGKPGDHFFPGNR